jgi:1-acyl-sn-glycerol-3-phosphate acyltransferase
MIDMLSRHNERIGRFPQRLVEHLYVVYLMGPILWLLVRLAFRIRVENVGTVLAAGPRKILAFRHFHEWDPIVVYFGSAWLHSLLRPSLHPMTLVGPFWMRRRWMRVISYLLGNIGVARGAGRGQSGLAQAARLLSGRSRMTVGIAPTGPIGRARDYEVKPGIGYLALDVPEVPVVPISVEGVQDVRLGLGVFLRRPVVTIRVGAPFRAGDISGSEDERVAAVCGRIRAEWERLESYDGAHDGSDRIRGRAAARERAEEASVQ